VISLIFAYGSALFFLISFEQTKSTIKLLLKFRISYKNLMNIITLSLLFLVVKKALELTQEYKKWYYPIDQLYYSIKMVSFVVVINQRWLKIIDNDKSTGIKKYFFVIVTFSLLFTWPFY